MALLRCSVFLLSCTMTLFCHAAVNSDEVESKAITAVLKAQFEQPNNVLHVAPITIVDDYAVVGWTQGQHGGRALLHQQKNQWVVQVCAGDALKEESELTQTGLSASQAHLLVEKIHKAEANLPTDYVQKLALFEKRIMPVTDVSGK